MKITTQLIWLALAFLLAGCVNPNPPVQESKDEKKYQGREETKALQNADNIGYDGTGIQKKLDKTLDQNEQRAGELEQQIEAQTGETQAPEEQ